MEPDAVGYLAGDAGEVGDSVGDAVPGAVVFFGGGVGGGFGEAVVGEDERGEGDHALDGFCE